MPTPVEREGLSRYNGFGGLACILKPVDTLADRTAASNCPLSPILSDVCLCKQQNIMFTKNVFYP